MSEVAVAGHEADVVVDAALGDQGIGEKCSPLPPRTLARNDPALSQYPSSTSSRGSCRRSSPTGFGSFGSLRISVSNHGKEKAWRSVSDRSTSAVSPPPSPVRKAIRELESSAIIVDLRGGSEGRSRSEPCP